MKGGGGREVRFEKWEVEGEKIKRGAGSGEVLSLS